VDGTVGNLVAQVARLLRRSFDERTRDIGVTRAQWQVLGLVRDNEGIKQGGLADLLEVEPITAARMIDRLQEQKLLERRADPADRRAWRIYLTARGTELIEEMQPYAYKTHEAALENVSAEDREVLKRVLETMLANLTRRATGAPDRKQATRHGPPRKS
jgi:DNA-binding MarR family transcriptional regulator